MLAVVGEIEAAEGTISWNWVVRLKYNFSGDTLPLGVTESFLRLFANDQCLHYMVRELVTETEYGSSPFSSIDLEQGSPAWP